MLLCSRESNPSARSSEPLPLPLPESRRSEIAALVLVPPTPAVSIWSLLALNGSQERVSTFSTLTQWDIFKSLGRSLVVSRTFY